MVDADPRFVIGSIAVAAVAMVTLFWFLARKYERTRAWYVASLVFCVLLGGWCLSKAVIGWAEGRINGPFRSFSGVFLQNIQPNEFWSALVVWASLGAFLSGLGLAALYLALVRKRYPANAK